MLFALGLTGAIWFVFIALRFGVTPVKRRGWHTYQGHELEFVIKTFFFSLNALVFLALLLFEVNEWAVGRTELRSRHAHMKNMAMILVYCLSCVVFLLITRDVSNGKLVR